MKNPVFHRVIKADGPKPWVRSTNLRTNDGVNWQANHMGNSSIVASKFIGITENSAAAASGNTNLVAEEDANGLSRATATFAHTADQSVYTLTASWQNSGSVKTIAKAAVCSTNTNTDTSADTHFLVTKLSSVAVIDSNDTLEIQWGVSI